MKKKYLLYSFIVIVLGLTIVSFISDNKTFSELENRNLKTKVTFNLKDFFYGSFKKNYETYINDQFPLRDKWISLKSRSEYVLGKVENNGTIYGNNDELFEKFDTIDEDIEKLEDKISSLEEDTSKYATDFTKLQEIMDEKTKLENELQVKYERWEYLNNLAEEIANWSNN